MDDFDACNSPHASNYKAGYHRHLQVVPTSYQGAYFASHHSQLVTRSVVLKQDAKCVVDTAERYLLSVFTTPEKEVG